MTDQSVQDSILLGVNVDHVATLRQARGTDYPDPVRAAEIAQDAGADSITVHLREDRRHIQDDDVARLKSLLEIPLNLEMAATGEMLGIACRTQPEECCLVPERRQELTTEGGLDAAKNLAFLSEYCDELRESGIRVSLFIDPDPVQIEAAAAIGVPMVELHTGLYAEAADPTRAASELARIEEMTRLGVETGLQVNAGHGLNYANVQPIAAIPGIVCLNIGHAIVAQAVLDGLANAVAQMKSLMRQARNPDLE